MATPVKNQSFNRINALNSGQFLQNAFQSNINFTKTFKLSALNTAPASASDTGSLGEIRIVNGFIYVCVATDTWQRAALSTF